LRADIAVECAHRPHLLGCLSHIPLPSRRIFYTHDPYENAVAERVNETLKYEYGLNKQAADLQILKKSVSQAVRIYNNERVHWSLGLRTPEEVHSSYNSLKYKSYSKKTA